MNCSICDTEMQEEQTTFSAKHAEHDLMISNIPIFKCPNCAFTQYSDDVITMLQELKRVIKKETIIVPIVEPIIAPVVKPKPDRILETDDACAYLGMCKATLYKKMEADKIIGRKDGRKWIFRTSDLDAYKESLKK